MNRMSNHHLFRLIVQSAHCNQYINLNDSYDMVVKHFIRFQQPALPLLPVLIYILHLHYVCRTHSCSHALQFRISFLSWLVMVHFASHFVLYRMSRSEEPLLTCTRLSFLTQTRHSFSGWWCCLSPCLREHDVVWRAAVRDLLSASLRMKLSAPSPWPRIITRYTTLSKCLSLPPQPGTSVMGLAACLMRH